MYEGRFWDAREIADEAGVNPATIRFRMRQHPEWGFDELIQLPMKTKHYLSHNGVCKPLKDWAREYDISYSTVLSRFKQGERDFNKLLSVSGGRVPLRLSEENVSWLKSTRWARKGQPDEWELACDLVGVPHVYVDDIRRILDDGE